MRSRAEIRSAIEMTLRAASVAILAWMLWLSLDRGTDERIASASSANLPSALRAWSIAGSAPDRISVRFDSTPSTRNRDWLAALAASGSAVMWSGDLPAAGIYVHPVASPRGGFTVLAAAPAGARVQLMDDVGALDTAQANVGGARFAVPSSTGTIRARVGGTIASAPEADSVQLKRLLVFGNAGWESKFVVAALEEDGWKVVAQMRVAPGVSVTQGSILPIDTSRYSAVIALDEGAGLYASDIIRYVSNGGGAILAGTAASLDAFTPIRAGVPGRLIAGSLLASEPGATTLRAVPLVPISTMRSDAIALDRRDGAIAAAARRHLAGRVLQQGYLDTWRWRMSGGDASVADHRAWWTRAVAGVAYAPRTKRQMPVQPDDAPVARLVASLGPSSRGQSASLASTAGLVPPWLLFALLAAGLIAEWASRRLRGAR